MLDIVRISYTTISYVTEENSRVVRSLQQCLPPSLRRVKLDKHSSQSQFGDPLVVYSLEVDDVDQIEAILEYLGSELDEKNKSYLTRNFENKVDLDERGVYLRIDKFKALEESIEITEGGDVIRIVISYAAYTNDQNTITEVKATMGSFGIIEV